eukprot:TRINITY_DN8920_c0_g1_i1.p1 TRINITY_DN8920_c0_g1~~TRINITY_DN8920_c0_g1_i1.p1  ORF type:complete len:110 (-),score=22.11 TRINITY_DN8920_c0_g1_i1:20-349(-)
MVDRMHFPKVPQIEHVGWYRENSVRFVKLSKTRNVLSFLTMMVIIPFGCLKWTEVAKINEHVSKGEPIPNYRTLPWKPYEWVDNGEGGNPKGHTGPEEMAYFKNAVGSQ